MGNSEGSHSKQQLTPQGKSRSVGGHETPQKQGKSRPKKLTPPHPASSPSQVYEGRQIASTPASQA